MSNHLKRGAVSRYLGQYSIRSLKSSNVPCILYACMCVCVCLPTQGCRFHLNLLIWCLHNVTVEKLLPGGPWRDKYPLLHRWRFLRHLDIRNTVHIVKNVMLESESKPLYRKYLQVSNTERHPSVTAFRYVSFCGSFPNSCTDQLTTAKQLSCGIHNSSMEVFRCMVRVALPECSVFVQFRRHPGAPIHFVTQIANMHFSKVSIQRSIIFSACYNPTPKIYPRRKVRIACFQNIWT